MQTPVPGGGIWASSPVREPVGRDHVSIPATSMPTNTADSCSPRCLRGPLSLLRNHVETSSPGRRDSLRPGQEETLARAQLRREDPGVRRAEVAMTFGNERRARATGRLHVQWGAQERPTFDLEPRSRVPGAARPATPSRKPPLRPRATALCLEELFSAKTFSALLISKVGCESQVRGRGGVSAPL